MYYWSYDFSIKNMSSTSIKSFKVVLVSHISIPLFTLAFRMKIGVKQIVKINVHCPFHSEYIYDVMDVVFRFYKLENEFD